MFPKIIKLLWISVSQQQQVLGLDNSLLLGCAVHCKMFSQHP